MTNGIKAVIEIKNNAYKEYIRSGMRHIYYVRLENLTTEHWNLIRVLNLCQNILVNFENLREHKFRHNFHDTLNTLCSCSLDQKTTSYYLLCSHNFSSAGLFNHEQKKLVKLIKTLKSKTRP